MDVRQRKAIVILYLPDLETPEAPVLALEQERIEHICKDHDLEILQSYVYRAGDFRTRNDFIKLVKAQDEKIAVFISELCENYKARPSRCVLNKLMRNKQIHLYQLKFGGGACF
ncbi:MAG: hypothetical protein AAGB32_00065 [Pseudomonadota bacterium]